VSDPKSEAGKRTITLPKMVMDAVEWHMERFTRPGPDAIVFIAVRADRSGGLGCRSLGPLPRRLWGSILISNHVLMTFGTTDSPSPLASRG
jgi:hypothetical protein